MLAGVPGYGYGKEAAALGSPEAGALVLNEPTFVVVEEDASTLLRFEADEPGVLTLVALGKPEGDVWLMVADDLGQGLRNGFVDRDATDAPGGEYGAAALAEPGVYFVAMGSWDGRAGVNLFASFEPLDGFVVEVDPQGRPDEALPIGVGLPAEQTADVDAGDHRDWYRFEASRNGEVRFRTRVPRGSSADLGIELFSSDDFSRSVAKGDADKGGQMGNESVDWVVREGEVVYVRVNAWETQETSAYTLEARWQD